MRRFGEITQLQGRRKAVRDRQARAGHVRDAVRPCRDHPARRPRSRHAGDRSGAGSISRRNRSALGPRRAGRRPGRRRGRNAADSAGAIARAAGRRSRSRRAHHARADPAPGQPDPGRRRRPGADRAFGFERRDSPAGISHPQRLSASSARSGHRSRCRRTDRALFAVADRLAAGGGCRRHRAAQSGRNRAGARDGHDRAASPATRSTMSPIVGSGPAGLVDRGVRGVRRLCVAVCDARSFGGQAGASARIENYLGFPTGISGPGADRARLQPGAEVRRRHHDSGRR